MNPLVSVIIPTFNCQGTLEQCLLAVRKSTYKDYEIIVVDGQSTDRTQEIARQYADMLLIPPENRERGDARNQGILNSNGEILVFIDGDNVIRPDTLARVVDYLHRHPEAAAVNGLIAKEHPNENFLSQYKNLYMHFVFRQLPERITFLHGSLYAVRRRALAVSEKRTNQDDTERGQELFTQGKRIDFLRDLEVLHLKRYNWKNFLSNEFLVPYGWAYVFLRFGGWRQLGRHGTGFSHASLRQLMSVIMAPTIMFCGYLAMRRIVPGWVLLAIFAIWFCLNASFLGFLARERGVWFGIRSLFITFIDGCIMMTGVVCGLIRWMPVVWGKSRKEKAGEESKKQK